MIKYQSEILILMVTLAVYFKQTLRPILRLLFNNKSSVNVLDCSESNIKMHILVPLYKEPDLINKIHKNFCKLSKTLNSKGTIYLITSNRESGEKSTSNLLKKLKWTKNIVLLNLDDKIIGKGAKLNNALEVIDADKKDWIGVYDADSCPDNRIIEYVFCSKANIIQQPSVYLNNANTIGNTMYSLSVFQTIWSFGHEVHLYKKFNRTIKKSKKSAPYFYLVGHGMFIRYSTLTSFGMFPDIYEDLRISIDIAKQRECIDIAPYPDYCDFVKNPTTYIKQSRNWANGSLFGIYDLSSKTNKDRKKLIKFVYQSYSSCFRWGLEGLFLVLSLTYFSIYRNIVFILILISLIFIFELILTNVILNKYSYFNSYRRNVKLHSSILRPFIHSIGPLQSLLNFAYNKLKPNIIYATRRTPKT